MQQQERFLHEIAKEKIVRFTAQELYSFMNNYSIRLGSGGFGVVYEGQFPNGIKIAVKIIHYDIKPGNVLLDSNISPKVADFGLTKLCNRDITHVSCSGYRGTPGYSALEFLMHSYPITHKCDVYSFGMLLFEIARKRRNTNANTNTDTLDWFPKKAWEEFEKNGLKNLVTMEINGIEEKDKEKVERTPESRPLMSTVVKMLEGGVEMLPPPNLFRYLYGLGTGDVAGGATVSSS
ncbi:hypothetical protein MKX01_020971 [Papaver californicum]|nr:hypothetical protein MKX01_020971 [Papaver californicum]